MGDKSPKAKEKSKKQDAATKSQKKDGLKAAASSVESSPKKKG